MSLSRVLRTQASEIKNSRDLPSWWSVLQVVLGVVFFLYIAYRFIAPDNAPNPELIDALGGGSSTVTETAPGTPSSTNAVSIDLLDGSGDQEVPEASVEAAEKVAEAIFTLDFTSVPLISGVTPPENLTQKYEDPQIAEPVIGSYTPQLISYVFAVDPDGPGPEGLRQVNVTVQEESGTWGWTGG